MDRTKEIYKVSRISIIANVLLSLFKAVCGVMFNSYALVSDSVHSLSDVFSTIVVMIGAYFSKKDVDDDHNYGHQKYESIAGLVLSMILFVTSFLIFSSGIEKIIAIINGQTSESPNKYALIGAFVSIIVKEWLYKYTVKVADRIDSPALKADAWHHRSDALSSIGTFIAIIGTMMGFAILDPLASIFIGVLIVKVGYSIALESIDQVTDKAVSAEISNNIKNAILEEEGVMSVESLKTRVHASKVYVDVSITVDKDLTVYEGHEIAERVHDKIEENFKDVLHLMVHVEPYLS